MYKLCYWPSYTWRIGKVHSTSVQDFGCSLPLAYTSAWCTVELSRKPSASYSHNLLVKHQPFPLWIAIGLQLSVRAAPEIPNKPVLFTLQLWNIHEDLFLRGRYPSDKCKQLCSPGEVPSSLLEPLTGATKRIALTVTNITLVYFKRSNNIMTVSTDTIETISD